MDEIRCPMCGRLNPPELEECQFCEARLRPLIISQPQDEEEVQELDGAVPSSDEEVSLPDWLKDLRSEDEHLPEQEEFSLEEEVPADAQGEADLLERLQGPLEEETELRGQSSTDQEAGIIPDWLSGEESSDAEQASAWMPLSEFEASSAETSESDEGDAPGAEEGAQEEVDEHPAEEEAEGEIPVWLKDLRIDETESGLPSEEELQAETEEPALENAETIDWLVDLQAEPATEEEEVEQFADWLLKGEKETPLETEEAEPEDWLTPFGKQEIGSEEGKEEAPEWMADLEIEAGEESVEQPFEEVADEIEQEGPPKWMAELEQEFSPKPSEEMEPPSKVDEEADKDIEDSIGLPLEEGSEEVEQTQQPEWMAELEKEFSPKPEPSEADLGSEPIIDKEGVETTPGVPAFDTEEEVDFLEALPEWADEVTTDQELEGEVEEAEPEIEEAEEAESEIEEAEIPSWMESMRPVESVAPDIGTEEEAIEEHVETSGPLAGLRGILTAESDFTRLRKPPVYSIKLQVTESQEARVSLLRGLLADEDKQKPLPAKPVISPQYLFRLVIALALIIPIAWVVITGGMHTPMPTPANIPAGVVDVHRLINNQLSANSSVLVAFDYEAGFSGELDIPSRAVLSHMMNKNPFLTMVSTTPSGPIMAERLINDLNQTPARQGSPFTNYANMGYIPGGTAGLLSLAQAPQKTVPYTLDSVAIWGSAPLDRIVTVADYSMVLVITESSDTARAWIEQVQPFLETNGIPLIMVVSAQAGPLVLPYYQGSPKQVQGVMVGLPDGVVYNNLSGQGDLPRVSWDAFGISVLISEIVLIVGAVVGAGMRQFTSIKKEED